MNEPEAIELLGRKMAAEGFLTVPQVGDGVGGNKLRTIDALLIQTWPSRGLQIIAVEYKRTRHDWMRELKDGAKAEAIAKHCDRFLVLAPKGIVDLGEVPDGWGLWEFDSRRRLLRTKPAPELNRLPRPPLTLSFLAAILRAAEKVNRNSSVLEADRSDLRAKHREDVDAEVKMRSRKYESLKDAVAKFETESGIEIAETWRSGKIGEGLQRYLRDPDGLLEHLKREKETLERMLKRITDALKS